MAEPLKNFFSPDRVREFASSLVRVYPAFDAKSFTREALRGLAEKELLDRARHLSNVMAKHLPEAYPRALEIVVASFGPARTGEENLGEGMASFLYLPHSFFIAERGLADFDLSMRSQMELTQRFTAEFSIRPYLARDPERVFRYLRQWATHSNAHVRRLVSEGTRLRLPWGTRVAWLDENPERILELLEVLQDDSSSMVRRSVANNLNDLGKLHPELLLRTCEAWTSGASAERSALISHALRSLAKRGDARALKILGYRETPEVVIESVRFDPRRVEIGERVKLSFALHNPSPRSAVVRVDAAVQFVKLRGVTSAKVFRLGSLEVPPKGRVALEKSFSLAVHTTRKPYPGKHAVEILVNGKAHPAGSFEVVAKRSAG